MGPHPGGVPHTREPRLPDLDPRTGMLGVGPNTNVLTHAGQTLALVEGGGANYRLTEELDTLDTCDFDGTLYGGYTAHPHRDPKTGELHAVSYSFARGRTVQYSVIGADGRARRTVDIAVHGSPMMHDFSLTEKYVVIYDLPVTFDPAEVIPVTVPRWLRAPPDWRCSRWPGACGCPARSPRGSTAIPAPSRHSRSPGTTPTPRASASCRARRTPTPSGGSTWTRATCSIR